MTIETELKDLLARCHGWEPAYAYFYVKGFLEGILTKDVKPVVIYPASKPITDYAMHKEKKAVEPIPIKRVSRRTDRFDYDLEKMKAQILQVLMISKLTIKEVREYCDLPDTLGAYQKTQILLRELYNDGILLRDEIRASNGKSVQYRYYHKNYGQKIVLNGEGVRS
jgi:hypothetical protein